MYFVVVFQAGAVLTDKGEREVYHGKAKHLTNLNSRSPIHIADIDMARNSGAIRILRNTERKAALSLE